MEAAGAPVNDFIERLRRAVHEIPTCPECGQAITTEGDTYQALVEHLESEHPQHGKV
jgi:hypothetical protein